ncbi:hypothetical protein ACQEVB_31890 [Pseudonocardia sp. CA-107938]|uniref:hypothetical protein n=1 Tax=Pseudonocardia sp. CA-107938 TaxID=3240021 RepID=UPI003D8BE660
MSTTPNVRRRAGSAVVIGLLTCALAGTACSSGGRGGSNQPGVEGPTSIAQGAPGPRVTINYSSAQDIAAQLHANDVSDPEKWAQLLVDNQPYPAGAAGNDKIRDVLTRGGASPDDIAKITNVIVP